MRVLYERFEGLIRALWECYTGALWVLYERFVVLYERFENAIRMLCGCHASVLRVLHERFEDAI